MYLIYERSEVMMDVIIEKRMDDGGGGRTIGG